MQRLNRNACTVPGCLANYQHGVHTWDNVNSQSKTEIRSQLELMQGHRCAYCEGPLDALGQHIEHFRRKRHFPQFTFDWNNLYWSCDQSDSCGHYKDRGAGSYNVSELIDPCTDDPDQYFLFRSDGTISIRTGLSPADQRRADETLRVFNLNPKWGRLRNMRKGAVSPYVSLVDGAIDLTVVELQQFFSDELAQAVTSPFYTAIRHVLTEP